MRAARVAVAAKAVKEAGTARATGSRAAARGPLALGTVEHPAHGRLEEPRSDLAREAQRGAAEAPLEPQMDPRSRRREDVKVLPLTASPELVARGALARIGAKVVKRTSLIALDGAMRAYAYH